MSILKTKSVEKPGVDWAIFRYSLFWGFLTTLVILICLYLGYLGFEALEAWMLRMEKEDPNRLWQYGCVLAIMLCSIVAGVLTTCYIYTKKRV